MIAEASIDRSLKAVEFLGDIFPYERLDVDIHNVATDENEVRLLGVDDVHPLGEIRPPVVIAKVQVADHHDFQILVKMLLRCQFKRLAHLVLVMNIPVNEYSCDGCEDTE